MTPDPAAVAALAAAMMAAERREELAWEALSFDLQAEAITAHLSAAGYTVASQDAPGAPADELGAALEAALREAHDREHAHGTTYNLLCMRVHALLERAAKLRESA